MTTDRDADQYLIRKSGAWYRPNSAGYTNNIAEAGRYSLAEAEATTHPNGPDGPRDNMSYELAPPAPAESGAVADRARKYLTLTDDQWETIIQARSLRRAFAADIKAMAVALTHALNLPPDHGGGEGETDYEKARHWIDRYAVGIDAEPQMDRFRAAKWNRRAATPRGIPMTERASDERLAEMLAELCGDERNGGLIRDMAYTVWHNCHYPKHEDENSDWSNDNLPLVNVANERVRENLRSIITELQELRKAVNSAWRIIDDVLIGPDPDEAMARLIDVLNPLATGDKP